MFRAVGRFFKTIGYILSGRLNQISDIWASNVEVMKEEYDEVIREKGKLANKYKSAVATLMTQEEKKKAKAEETEKKIQKTEKMLAGATNKLQSRVTTLKKDGLTEEGIKQDDEYKRFFSAYKDFKSTLKEQEELLSELEEDIEELAGQVTQYETELKDMNREMTKLIEEKGEAVADVLSAQVQEQIADTLTSIGKDKTGDQLANLRDRRLKAKADAKLSQKISGATTKSQENEFLSAVDDSDEELDSLLFGNKEESSDSEKKTTESEAVASE